MANNNTSEFFVRGSVPTKTFNALGDYNVNDDIENNNDDDEANANISTKQSVARRKFEKFRTKLVELFFTNSTTSTTDATTFKTSPTVNTTTNNNTKNLSPVLLNESLNNNNNNNSNNNKRRKSSSTSSSNHFNIDSNLNTSLSSASSPSSPSPTNTMLISNYYYGYKTMQFNATTTTTTTTNNDEENHEQIITSKNTKSLSKKSKASNNNKTKNITTDCSSTSSIIVDEIESNSCSSSSSYRNSSNNSSKHTGELNSNANSIMLSSLSDTNSSNSCSFFHKPSGTIMIDSNYDSLSMTTNIFDFYQHNDATSSSSMMNDGVMASSQVNPFLNKSLTNLISFNSDMSLLDSYFETSLHLIDGNLNFKINKKKLLNNLPLFFQRTPLFVIFTLTKTRIVSNPSVFERLP
jgi:hypothetical protein